MASKLATIIADFRTSLNTKLAIGATTATLQNATDDDGVALPTGKYFFTLDGDSSQKEHIVCDLDGTDLTNIKSVSRQGVQTTGTVREHRIGASVVITDFAHILYINNLLDGTDRFEDDVLMRNVSLDGKLTFTGTTNSGLTVNSLTTGQRDALVSPANGTIIYNTTTGEFNIYQGGAWSVMASGSTQPDASTTVAGKVEIATVAEQGTATANGGTGAPLVPANGNLVKTSSGAGDENKIAILNAAGSFADGFLNAAESGASKTVKSKANSKLDDSLLGMTTAGDLPYSDGTDIQRLALGTLRQMLQVNAAGNAPEWARNYARAIAGLDGYFPIGYLSMVVAGGTTRANGFESFQAETSSATGADEVTLSLASVAAAPTGLSVLAYSFPGSGEYAELSLKMEIERAGSGVPLYGFLGLFASSVSGVYSNTLTQNHAAFLFNDNSVYTSTANGSSQTISSAIPGVSSQDDNDYRIQITSTQIIFLINGVQVGSHSTNLPTGNIGTPQILNLQNNSGQNVQFGVYIKRPLLLLNID